MLDGANLSKKDRKEEIAPPYFKGRNWKRSSGGRRRVPLDMSEWIFLTLRFLLHRREAGGEKGISVNALEVKSCWKEGMGKISGSVFSASC